MAKNMQPVLKRCKTLGIEPGVMGIDKKSNRNPKQNRKSNLNMVYSLQKSRK